MASNSNFWMNLLKKVQRVNMLQPKLNKPNSATLAEMKSTFQSDVQLLNRKLEGRVSHWL